MAQIAAILAGLAILIAGCGGSGGQNSAAANPSVPASAIVTAAPTSSPADIYRASMRKQLDLLAAQGDVAVAAAQAAIYSMNASGTLSRDQLNKAGMDLRDMIAITKALEAPECFTTLQSDIKPLLNKYNDVYLSVSIIAGLVAAKNAGASFFMNEMTTENNSTKPMQKLVLLKLDAVTC